MTRDEVIRQYMIPETIIDAYEKLKYCSVNRERKSQYNDQDLERISLLMTLYDIGFNQAEITGYMMSVLSNFELHDNRMQLLNQKREKLLREIHHMEKCLEQLDYLRYEIMG